jgi:hypothetical protein
MVPVLADARSASWACACAATTPFKQHPSTAGSCTLAGLCLPTQLLPWVPGPCPSDVLFDVAKGREQRREGGGSVSNKVRRGYPSSLTLCCSLLPGCAVVVPCWRMLQHPDGLASS